MEFVPVTCSTAAPIFHGFFLFICFKETTHSLCICALHMHTHNKYVYEHCEFKATTEKE